MDWGEFFWPTTDKRAQEAQIEGQKIINESAGIKLRQQKEADEINKIAGQATPHISRAITLAKTGDIEGAATAINKAYGYIPNGGKFELVDSPTGKQFRLTGLDGSSSTMPATNQSLSENIAELSNMLDPNNRVQTWMKARMETEDFNKKQMQTPQRDGKGNIFYTQFKDGRMVAVDESGKELAAIPQDIAYVEGREKFKADTDKTVSETAKNKQQARLAGEQAEWVGPTAKANIVQSYASANSSNATAEHTRKVTASGGKDADPYDVKFADALNKGYGVQVNAVDKEGDPIVYSDDTITEAQKWAAGKGYILRATKTKKGYALRGYEKIQEGTEAPIVDENGNQVSGVYRKGEWVPAENKAPQAPSKGGEQVSVSSKQPVLTGRKVTSYASALADESSDKPAIRKEILKTYGQGALNRVDREAKRIAKERAQTIADSKKPLLEGTSAAGVKIRIPNIFRGGN